MSLFSETNLVAARIICPVCRQAMQYVEEDHFFRCPTCNSEFWVPDKSVPCPACGKPMKYFPEGCYQCTGCQGEYWPGEPGLNIWRDPNTEPPENQEELKARCYYRGDVEFKGGSKSGKKRKKKPKKQDFSELYLD